MVSGMPVSVCSANGTLTMSNACDCCHLFAHTNRHNGTLYLNVERNRCDPDISGATHVLGHGKLADVANKINIDKSFSGCQLNKMVAPLQSQVVVTATELRYERHTQSKMLHSWWSHNLRSLLMNLNLLQLTILPSYPSWWSSSSGHSNNHHSERATCKIMNRFFAIFSTCQSAAVARFHVTPSVDLVPISCSNFMRNAFIFGEYT